MTTIPIETTAGNSPVKHIPRDYYPKGCGYWFTIPEGSDAGKKLFFRDSTHGNDTTLKHTVFFVHGNPECSYIYKNTIHELIAGSNTSLRIIAVDHIGFGLSDQASYEMVSMDHAENLFQLIRYLNLTNVTLVVHDWGGPIGIGAFLKEPFRVDNLLITNTTVFPIGEDGSTYDNYPIKWFPWSMGPSVIPDKLWGTYASYAIYRTPANPFEILLQYAQHVCKILCDFKEEKETSVQKLYREQFNSKANIRSSKRLVRQTSTWAAGNIYHEPSLGERDTRPFYEFIQKNIKKAWGPEGQNIGVHAVIGGWDPLAKDAVIDQWIDNLPQLKDQVEVFKSVSHFVETVKHKEIASAILNMIRG